MNIVCTLYVRYSSDIGVYLDTREKEAQMTTESQLNKRCVGYIESICRINHEDFGSSEDGCSDTSSFDSPQMWRQRNKRLKRTTAQTEDDPYYLIQSDHVTFVNLEGTTFFGVFVSLDWVRRLDNERNIFLLIREESEHNMTHLVLSTIG